MIEAVVDSIRVSLVTQQRVVFLREVSGERHLPIWIGPFEGEALALALEKIETPRPITFTFAARLLQAAGGRLREVRISRLVGDVFYAVAVVDGPAGSTSVDARPSDALNLAVRMGAPIRTAPAVIEQSTRGSMNWEEVRRVMLEKGLPAEHMPSQEQYEHIQSLISGETTGGAAAIVAQLRG